MKILVSGVLVLFFSIGSARAQLDDKPEPPRGIYTGMTTGGMYFLDDSDRGLYKNALTLGVKFGYDILKYLAVETHFRFSGNETSRTGTTNQTIPQSFLNYQTLGFIKGLYPITRRISVFVDFGGGFWYSDPNLKSTVGSSTRGVVTGGGGLQYFLKIRGLAMGVDASVSSVRDLNGLVLQPNAYLRYTF